MSRVYIYPWAFAQTTAINPKEVSTYKLLCLLNKFNIIAEIDFVSLHGTMFLELSYRDY